MDFSFNKVISSNFNLTFENLKYRSYCSSKQLNSRLMCNSNPEQQVNVTVSHCIYTPYNLSKDALIDLSIHLLDAWQYTLHLKMNLK